MDQQLEGALATQTELVCGTRLAAANWASLLTSADAHNINWMASDEHRQCMRASRSTTARIAASISSFARRNKAQ